jgi:hypothetical protein
MARHGSPWRPVPLLASCMNVLLTFARDLKAATYARLWRAALRCVNSWYSRLSQITAPGPGFGQLVLGDSRSMGGLP